MDGHWEEEYKRAEEEAGEVPESELWESVKRVIGIVLIILTISYVLIDPNVRAVVIGFFESSTSDEGTFSHDGKIIEFAEGTYEELAGTFRENQDREVSVCLMGTIEGNRYLVNEIAHPRTHFQSVYRVVSEPCPTGTIIDLHTHPYQKCVASQTDLAHLENLKKRNEDALLAVMCTEDRISFYG